MGLNFQARLAGVQSAYAIRWLMEVLPAGWGFVGLDSRGVELLSVGMGGRTNEKGYLWVVLGLWDDSGSGWESITSVLIRFGPSPCSARGVIALNKLCSHCMSLRPCLHAATHP